MNAGIDQALLRAWRKTEYRVGAGADAMVLRIDQRNADLAELMQREGIHCAAYITADNPHSTVVSESRNTAARQHLEARLRRGEWRFLPGLGIDPESDHPGEHSLLVLGIAADEAVALGREFEQDAILVIDADATPRLHLCRSLHKNP